MSHYKRISSKDLDDLIQKVNEEGKTLISIVTRVGFGNTQIYIAIIEE